MKDKLLEIQKKALEQIENAKELSALNDVRVSILGKKGEMTTILKGMKDVSPEDRPKVGQMVNDTREIIEAKLAEAKEALEAKEMELRLSAETIDVTLPAKKNKIGHRHPNTIALQEVEKIFIGMGYEVVEGPEVELDYYNFEALNIPANHPAKDEQDTFYITKDILLRTQTSPIQIHAMEQGKLPLRMLAPGRVFRSDEVDATHSPSFHQIEGLVVDRGVTFSDLKGTLEEFAKKMFGENTKVKFRPHHFPFTEPSAEIDIQFQEGPLAGKWLEVSGCGQVHPNVVTNMGLDPERYIGFAFGSGIDRLAMLRYGVSDLRLFFEGDVRFLAQFA